MAQTEAYNPLAGVAPGIYRFDTAYRWFGNTACYIVVEEARAALVDCGVPANVPPLLEALASLGIKPDAVDHLIATHVHLDHAGAAGVLMEQLPNARLSVHPSGAPHMIDTEKLEQGVRALYGDKFFDREYVPLRPVPTERVDETPDDAVVSLAGRELRMIYTPGHAWHHQSIFDPRTGTLMVGDTFGVGYPEFIDEDRPFVIPVMPPPHFNPEAFTASLDRILALEPTCVAPTHFETIHEPEKVAADLRRLLAQFMEQTWQADSIEGLEADLKRLLSAELERRGRGDETEKMCDLYGLDIWLTAEGMWYWRRKQEARAAENAAENQGGG